jgi:GDPmannose 4,6-dehydratase
VTTALVLGSNGQDGSYLADVLLERGFDVAGAARQQRSRWVEHPRFRHVPLDVADASALSRLLDELRPTRIYALAASHGPAGYSYEADWRTTLEVNVGSVQTCLEYLRLSSPDARLFVASSVKAFGQTPPAIIDEATPRVSSCLYSITKNAAADLVAYYRATHGVWASVGYLFNHDSPRRPPEYFLPRLAAQLAAHLKGEPAPAPLASFDFWCDWGSSPEFMGAAASLLELDQAEDVVMATGAPIHAARLVAALSSAAGAPASAWARASMMDEPRAVAAEAPYRARIDNLRRHVGAPRQDGLDVVLWILREIHGIDLRRPTDWRWSGPD